MDADDVGCRYKHRALTVLFVNLAESTCCEVFEGFVTGNLFFGDLRFLGPEYYSRYKFTAESKTIGHLRSKHRQCGLENFLCDMIAEASFTVLASVRNSFRRSIS